MQVGGAVPSVSGRRPLLTGAAARLAACHEATIRRAVRAGDLPAVQLGPRGHLRIPVVELERWLKPVRDPEEPT
jgi:excisionase family DNA binding protein